MNQTYYNEKIGDYHFKVTEKYIQYGSDIIPTSSISYVSIKRFAISWFPLIFLLSSIVVSMYVPFVISIILIVIGVIALMVTIIKSQKRLLKIYSHSGQYIYIIQKKSGDYQAMIDAIYNLLEQNVSVVKEPRTSEASNTSTSTDL